MKLLHSRVIRSSEDNQLVLLPGAPGNVVAFIAACDVTTGYRNLPFYLCTLGAKNLGSTGLSWAPGVVDPTVAIPLGAGLQGGITEWVTWSGRAVLGGDLRAVGIDISSAVAGDAVECVVGVSE